MTKTPLLLHPCYKEYLWGGNRLKREYGKLDAPDITAESWELSCHADGISRIDGGPYSGKSIADLGRQDRISFWGSLCGSEFPLLVKLIDAKKDLSVQVHPSDHSARHELGECGKAEMWYIVDCAPHSFIYYGFSKQISRNEFLERAREGSICEVLNRVPVTPGDVFYILPGTIHAIGAGNFIAEIQQSSNTTFRVYDYHRTGPDGKFRPLHLERAAEVVDLKPVIPHECRANSTMLFPGFTMSEMFSCPYFRAYRLDIQKQITLNCDRESFHHLLCVDGSAVISAEDREYPIYRGLSYFIPASLGEYQIIGNCRVLLSRL